MAANNVTVATPLYGLVAEFNDAESLLNAARRVRSEGYREVRAYTPYWVDGLTEILGQRSFGYVPYLAIGGLVLGVLVGFLIQYYTSVYSYPLNVGGRPLNSWPSFLLVTFEIGILFAGLGTVLGFFLQTNLPLPYHPVFNTPKFELASRDHFFLCVEVTDPKFQLNTTKALLESLEPLNVSEVSC
jgi:hypothetical protein